MPTSTEILRHNMEMSDKIRNATEYASWNALLDVTDEETWNAILITTFNATRIATEDSTRNATVNAIKDVFRMQGHLFNGEFGLLELTDAHRKKGYTEEDVPNGPPAVCIWPSN